MLRLWRDRLLVSLEPPALHWVRLAGTWAPRIAEKGSVDADPAFGQEPWHGAVAALRRAAEIWRAERLRVSVVLSNHFVRYAVVPPSRDAASPHEELALARFHFARIHGERAKAWELRLAQGRSDTPRLACAVDAGLLEALRACFPKASRAHLGSVQPYLMSAFNLWRARMPKEGAWFLLPEHGRACLALHAKGAWRAVQNVRGTFSAPEDWEAMLEREKHCAGVDAAPRTVLVRSNARALAALRATGGWNMAGLGLPALSGFLPAEDERYAMGLTAR